MTEAQRHLLRVGAPVRHCVAYAGEPTVGGHVLGDEEIFIVDVEAAYDVRHAVDDLAPHPARGPVVILAKDVVRIALRLAGGRPRSASASASTTTAASATASTIGIGSDAGHGNGRVLVDTSYDGIAADIRHVKAGHAPAVIADRQGLPASVADVDLGLHQGVDAEILVVFDDRCTHIDAHVVVLNRIRHKEQAGPHVRLRMSRQRRRAHYSQQAEHEPRPPRPVSRRYHSASVLLRGHLARPPIATC